MYKEAPERALPCSRRVVCRRVPAASLRPHLAGSSTFRLAAAAWPRSDSCSTAPAVPAVLPASSTPAALPVAEAVLLGFAAAVLAAALPAGRTPAAAPVLALLAALEAAALTLSPPHCDALLLPVLSCPAELAVAVAPVAREAAWLLLRAAPLMTDPLAPVTPAEHTCS